LIHQFSACTAPYFSESYVSTHPPGQYRIEKMKQEIAAMEARRATAPSGGRYPGSNTIDEVLLRAFITP